LEITIPSDLRQSDSVILDIAYEVCLFEKPISQEKENVGETTGTIGEEGVYLSTACAWYPDMPSLLAAFRITIITPAGYGKTAIVFHMLRQMVGDDLFYKSRRRFYKDKIWQRAGWKDIQHIFEEDCKTDLSWFFEQWINRIGAPFIELGKTEVVKASNGWLTRIKIIQTCPQTLLGKGEPYRLFVPIEMEMDGGNFSTVTELKESSSTVIIQTESQPIHIAIDPQCDVFRRLHREEIPPAIDFILGDNEKVIVYPTGGEGALQASYKKLAELLGEKCGIQASALRKVQLPPLCRWKEC